MELVIWVIYKYLKTSIKQSIEADSYICMLSCEIFIAKWHFISCFWNALELLLKCIQTKWAKTWHEPEHSFPDKWYDARFKKAFTSREFHRSEGKIIICLFVLNTLLLLYDHFKHWKSFLTLPWHFRVTCEVMIKRNV